MCGNSNVWGFQRRECSLMLQMPSDKARCSWKGLLSAHVGVKKCCKIGILCPLGPTKHAPSAPQNMPPTQFLLHHIWSELPYLVDFHLIWLQLVHQSKHLLGQQTWGCHCQLSLGNTASAVNWILLTQAFKRQHHQHGFGVSSDSKDNFVNQSWIGWIQSFRHHQYNVCVSMSKKMSKELNDDMD